jgi:hypothetical protein
VAGELVVGRRVAGELVVGRIVLMSEIHPLTLSTGAQSFSFLKRNFVVPLSEY